MPALQALEKKLDEAVKANHKIRSRAQVYRRTADRDGPLVVLLNAKIDALKRELAEERAVGATE